MGIMDKFKKSMNNNDYSDNYDDYYDSFEGGYDDVPPQEEPVAQSIPQAEPAQPYYAPAPQQPAAQIGLGGGSSMSLGGAAIELKVVKPTEFKDGPSIAEHLLSKRTVVLNLEDADKDTSRRLIDFLFGVAYSIGGEIKKVANNAYVITPQNVAISNDKGGAQQAAPAQPQQPMGGFGF